MRRADGALPGRLSRFAVPSSFRFRVAHSVTTRRPPAKPTTFIARQSAAPLRQPSVHAVSSLVRNGSSELMRLRNMSARAPRTTWRTNPRDLSVRLMISLMATPWAANARMLAFSASRSNHPECCRRSAAVKAAGSTAPPPTAGSFFADTPNRRRHPELDLRRGLGSRPGAAKRAAEGGGLEADARRRDDHLCRRHYRTTHNV